MKALLVLLWATVGALSSSSPASQTSLPAPPKDYVLDQAGILDPSQKTLLSVELAQFERQTSSQIWVCILPGVPEDYAMEDFTQRTAEAWGVGRKGKDNGIVLFVFPSSRQLRIEVGYGLEGAVPDALANSIINQVIVPSFRAGDMAGGVIRGVTALMEAARGEYQGTGHTFSEAQNAHGGREGSSIFFVFWLIFIIYLVISMHRSHQNGGTVYSPRGRRDVFFPGSFGRGGGFGGGGFGGGSMGGGGGFGGGGASGRW